MFRNHYSYSVSSQLYMDHIFMMGLPNNSFINKGRCAIRATSLELKHRRCSIITVPNISIILNKMAEKPEIKGVYGDISLEDVEGYLVNRSENTKIMTTPEGLEKIIKAASKLGILSEIYNNWFLLLDEAHTFITEAYRDNICKPFEYFWNFANKSILSATPYYFSDPSFRKLDLYEVRLTEKLAKVNLIHASSVVGTLNYILNQAKQCKGNLHIFYNSVTEIKNAILRANLTDCNIYCSDDKDRKNRKTLGDIWRFYKGEPKTGEYKKINFYTCKYFEGWDLYDDNATILFVTDVYKPHTKVGVGTKGKQAIGRLRKPADRIFHLTNHNNLKYMKPLEKIREEYLKEATYLVQEHNNYILRFGKTGKLKDTKDLSKYADVEEDTKSATLNTMKLDQQINEAANNEIYNHIDFIKEDWEKSYHEVELYTSTHVLETTTKIKRKSGRDQLKEDYLKIEEYKNKLSSGTIFFIEENPEEEVKKRNPLAYLAHKYLTKEKLEELKYNVKKVTEEVIVCENLEAETKLLKLLHQTFKIGEFYSNQEAKSKLQNLYNKLNIRDNKGNIRKATATQLGESGRFEIDSKAKSKDGKLHGLRILRSQFKLKMAA